MIDLQTFDHICDETLSSLLIKFSFVKTSVEHADYGYGVVYQNATTGLSIDYELHWTHVFVSLFKLVDGQLPSYRLVDADERGVPLGLTLEQIIQRRNPSFLVWQGGKGDEVIAYARTFTPDSLRKVLSEFQDALTQYAADILAGDFELFDEFKGTVPSV